MNGSAKNIFSAALFLLIFFCFFCCAAEETSDSDEALTSDTTAHHHRPQRFRMDPEFKQKRAMMHVIHESRHKEKHRPRARKVKEPDHDTSDSAPMIQSEKTKPRCVFYIVREKTESGEDRIESYYRCASTVLYID